MEETPKTALESVNYDGREVKLCEDGKYRWTHPYHMLKNPTIILTVLKIFGGIFLAGFLIYIIATLKNGHADRILADLKWWGVAILVFLVLLAISYFIVAAMYGFKYIVKFTMDENGVLHEQIPEQAKKAKKLGAVVAAAGAIGGNIGRVGQGAMVAAHTSLASDFKVVRKVKPLKKLNTIKVSEPFAKNQIYTTPEDFDFVLNYILEHCPKVKK